MDGMTKEGAKWIWAEKRPEGINQYAEFRREFEIADLQENEGTLYISADKDYVVWLNDTFVACGQFSDYPDDKTYDVLDIRKTLRPGKNALCILVYCQVESTSTYLQGEPGLWYALEAGNASFASNEDTYCRISPAYKSGPIAKITVQLSFTYVYDAGKEDDWRSLEYIPGDGWEPAYEMARLLEGKPTALRKRPIAKLDIKERVKSHILAQGRFIRMGEPDQIPAQSVQTDFMSPVLIEELFDPGFSCYFPSNQGNALRISDMEHNQGIYIVIDLGREDAGLFEIELDANAGTILDIGYGQHLCDLRVRAAVGGRNFANRYICKEGRQSFIHYTTRLGGRYLQLHISNIQDHCVLYYVGLRPTDYPLEVKGEFKSPNSLWNRIYDVGIRTLHLCMHEHYEDTPWREQALYTMDSRNEALCGYYCFGEYDFPQASFDLLGKGLKGDGYLELCAPADVSITIPCFSMAWIMELADHLLYSGRVEPVKNAMPKVKEMIASYVRNMKNNLLVSPQGKRYWHFYEWAEGLDHREIFSTDGLQVERFDAPLNAFYAMALDAAAKLAQAVGDFRLADEYRGYANTVKKAIEVLFWDDHVQAYTTYAGQHGAPHFSELTQALILCAGACSSERASIIREKLASPDNNMIETTLSHSIYKFEALLQEPEKYAETVFSKIEKDWGYMLYNGATTFWETMKGAGDFNLGGSLCHGWSAIPVYFYQAYLLGVKPLEPGFKTFTVKPVTTVLDRASGKIPTPCGEIYVSWNKYNGETDCIVSHPQGLKQV